MSGVRSPWWIIGSAAVALHGAGSIAPRDVDVLLDREDLTGLAGTLEIEVTAPAADTRFRSEAFATWHWPPLPVEFMAGLHIFGTPLVPATRMRITIGDASLFVPDAEELIAILGRFGRPKDHARAGALRKLASVALEPRGD